MNDSISLQEEAKRIHWRLAILQGKHGEKVLQRILAMTYHGFPERLVT